MVVIIDYGVGNLFSLVSSFKSIGVDAIVSGDKEVILKADKIILPGVGAFGDASNKLFSSGLADVVIDMAKKGVPLMGICLGMQVLFDKSYEYGEHKGLGLIKGKVMPISDVIPKDLKIPHIGWNALNFNGDKNEIFKYLNDGDYVYFVHSFYCDPADETVSAAKTEYGIRYCCAVEKDNIFATQFHPEKSGEVGLAILAKFARRTRS